MTKNVYEEIHAGEAEEDGLKDMDVVMDAPFTTTFDDVKQEEQVMSVGEKGIWFDRESDNLLDVNDHSIFYTDFPLLPDFPCMSSSSSSSSTPVPTQPVASTSSSLSASSSSATSWAVLRSEAEDCSKRKRPHHQSSQSHECYDQVVDAASAAVAAALSSTASMEVLPPPDDSNRDIDCINVMENFGYMDLLDNSDIWDPSSIFESENPQDQFQEKKPAAAPHQEDSQQDQNTHNSQEDGNGQLYFLQGNSELAAIFLEWLKQNKDHISAEDMRNIKLKRSTIECASKRLGSTKEGKKQLLKLILEWVEQYQLHKKRTRDQLASDSDPYHYQEQQGHETANPNPNTDLNCNTAPPDQNNCFSPSQWAPPRPETGNFVAVPAAFPPTVGGGYVCDPYSTGSAVPAPNQSINGNLYPPTSEYQPMDSPHSWTAPPFAMGAQYNPFPGNSSLPVSGSHAQCLYGNPYPYQVFDGSGERLVRLGSSATKEARKKRMARQRRISMHQYRHHNHQNQHQNLMSEQHARIVGEDCTSSLANPGNWIFWSPGAAAAPPASTMPPLVPAVETSYTQTKPVDRGHMQIQNHHRQAPSDRKQGWKTEKNLKFLLQKVLKQSDVGNLGRIVLPKKEAETHLPELDSRDGIPIAMEDIGTSNVWNMRYRFWPNNKSRMYLLENTGDFVRVNGLQEGDFIVIYSDTKCGKYLIRGVKVRQPGTKPEGKKPARRNQRNVAQAATSFSLASFKQTVK